MEFGSRVTKWFDNATIGKKITIICLILVIIPTLVLGIVAYTSAEAAIKDNIKTNLETQSKDLQEETITVYGLTQAKVNSDLNVLRQSFYSKGKPEIVTGNMMLGSSYKVNDNFEIVDGVQELIGGTATVFQKKGDQAIRISTNVIGEDGKRAVGTPVSAAVYDAVINKGQTYYGTATVVGKKYNTAYEPIKNQANDIIGILYVGVDEAETIGLLQEQIKSKKIGENGYVFVLDSTGLALIHPTREGKNDSDLPFIKEIVTQKEGYLEYTYNGIPKIAVFTYFEPFDWIIVANADITDFTGPIDNIRNTIIIVMILGIIGGFIVATLFGRSISNRMDNLVKLANRVRDGDLSGDMETIHHKDEIGILGRAFADVVVTFQLFRDEIRTISTAAASGNLNVRGDVRKFQGDYAVIIDGVNDTVDAMAVPLQEAMKLAGKYAAGDFTARMNPDIHLEGEFVTFQKAFDTIGIDVSQALAAVKIQMENLAKEMIEVSGRVDEVTEETEEAHTSIEDVSEGVGQVAQIASAVSDLADKSGMTTQQILAAMQDLATTVSSVAAKMEHVSVLTNTASELSEKGKEAAGQAESGMHGIMQSSSAIDQMNQEIANQMQEIGRIVDIIGSIAEETNLLALNAAIEAARAGEAGLGFAVVASEVKELANESQKSAENIAGIISGLQKKSIAMADAVKKSITEVEIGNNSVSETLAVFNEIVGSIAVINANMSEVAAASEEQAASVEEVTATVNEFSDMVQQTAKESVGLAAASEESSAAVEQITQMVSQVNESMEKIRNTTELAEEAVQRIEQEMMQFKYY
ncbi:Cache 3/Cache 2 fusion domain-containing protein [Methanospirillum purgamenti]|uniref:Cache 3/Cache 2 fusion domain-containing protein n=1 Tax=Methanospirillum hungatei TaxID=2203 RepID=A0A8F5VQN9_METHU|nr:Cache 3/Cache 2 fusion domain-containing protein [Methanospirillum hungatei]QXO96127.1 Cache 3/Cache 2 fusion domain-containing protein [Methanospirillum hungatei]